MEQITPERRAHLSMIGRVGGAAAPAVTDTAARARTAQRHFRASFYDGHVCSVCPQVVIPDFIDDAERCRRADQLYSNHFRRLAMNRSLARRRVRVLA